MAQLSISAAARAVGKDRGTLYRYIKSGKLNSTKDATGNPVIETAELLRVFGSLKGDSGKISITEPVVNHVENSSIQQIFGATLGVLKEQLRVSQERETRLLSMLEQEQEARRELEHRLLSSGDFQELKKQLAAEQEKNQKFQRLFGGRDMPQVENQKWWKFW